MATSALHPGICVSPSNSPPGVPIDKITATFRASSALGDLYSSSIFGVFAGAKQVPSAKDVPAAKGASLNDNATAAQQHVLSSQATHHPEGHPSQAHPIVHKQSHAPPDRGPLWEWTARVHCKKYELGTSYAVLIFLGEVPENPREWRTTPNYVGAHYALVDGDRRGRPDVVIEGFVHLDHAIAQHSGLGSLDPEVVIPYLTSDLHWRAMKSDGAPSELDSLEVVVFATPLTYPPGTMFPVPGPPERHNEITYGKPGGSQNP